MKYVVICLFLFQGISNHSIFLLRRILGTCFASELQGNLSWPLGEIMSCKCSRLFLTTALMLKQLFTISPGWLHLSFPNKHIHHFDAYCTSDTFDLYLHKLLLLSINRVWLSLHQGVKTTHMCFIRCQLSVHIVLPSGISDKIESEHKHTHFVFIAYLNILELWHIVCARFIGPMQARKSVIVIIVLFIFLFSSFIFNFLSFVMNLNTVLSVAYTFLYPNFGDLHALALLEGGYWYNSEAIIILSINTNFNGIESVEK